MPAAPVLLFFAVLVGWALRAVDLESCALFIPGGVYGTAKEAYGARVSRLAAAALLVECLLFGALAASAAGHSLATVAALVPHLSTSLRRIAVTDVATIAVGAIGLGWWRLRRGRVSSERPSTPIVWGVIGAVAALIIWGLARGLRLPELRRRACDDAVGDTFRSGLARRRRWLPVRVWNGRSARPRGGRRASTKNPKPPARGIGRQCCLAGHDDRRRAAVRLVHSGSGARLVVERAGHGCRDIRRPSEFSGFSSV